MALVLMSALCLCLMISGSWARAGLFSQLYDSESPTCEEEVPIDLLLIADQTRSVGTENFRMLKKFLQEVAEDLDPISEDGNRVTVMTYHKEPKILNSFNEESSYNKEKLLELIKNIPETLGGTTRTDLALKAAGDVVFTKDEGDRPKAPNVIILFTDGETNSESQRYEDIMPSLKGVHVIAVGVGGKISKEELQRIAGDNVLMVNSFEELSESLKFVETFICNIDGGYSDWDEWSDCTETCGGGVQTRTRTCTNPPPSGNGKDCTQLLGEDTETQECNTESCPIDTPLCNDMDLVLIVDKTKSIGRNNFLKMRDVLEKIVESLDIGKDDTHVSIITYAKNSKVRNNFKDSSSYNADELRALMGKISNKLGNPTRTDKALVAANTTLFTPEGGDRPGFTNALVLFTDGRTHKDSQPYETIMPSLREKGVYILAVGIGKKDKIFQTELKRIAGDNVIVMEDFQAMLDNVDGIKRRVCQSGDRKRHFERTNWDFKRP